MNKYKKPVFKRRCPVCGTRFKTTRRRKKYDHTNCKQAAYNARKTELVDKARAAGL